MASLGRVSEAYAGAGVQLGEASQHFTTGHLNGTEAALQAETAIGDLAAAKSSATELLGALSSVATLTNEVAERTGSARLHTEEAVRSMKGSEDKVQQGSEKVTKATITLLQTGEGLKGAQARLVGDNAVALCQRLDTNPAKHALQDMASAHAADVEIAKDAAVLRELLKEVMAKAVILSAAVEGRLSQTEQAVSVVGRSNSKIRSLNGQTNQCTQQAQDAAAYYKSI